MAKCKHCGNKYWRGCRADAVAEALNAAPGAAIPVPGCMTAEEFADEIHDAKRLIEVGRRGIDKNMKWSTVARFNFGGKDEDKTKPAPLPPIIPNASDKRENIPLADFLRTYFPRTLVELSVFSKHGNDKHNPGEPLHWSKGKSQDHINKAARHLFEVGTRDEWGYWHDIAFAWRAMANAEMRLEAEAVGVSYEELLRQYRDGERK